MITMFSYDQYRYGIFFSFFFCSLAILLSLMVFESCRSYIMFQLWRLITDGMSSSIRHSIPFCNTVFFTGAMLGIARIAPNRYLDHPDRARIYQYIQKHPGAHFRMLERNTGINRGTLEYHLEKIVQANKIIAIKDNGFTRYFQNCGTFSHMDFKILSHLNSIREREILFKLSYTSMSLNTIQAQLDLSKSSTYWHLKRLISDGIVSIKKEGRKNRYCLCENVIPFIIKYINVPQ